MNVYTWDFNDALGDTIMEKYEGLYVKLMEIGKDIGGTDVIITSNEIASMFETATCGFYPLNVTAGKISYIGRINNRFEIHKSDLVPKDELFAFGTKGSALLRVVNFII